jgi:hypothetical protein
MCRNGLHVVSEAHGLAHDGQRYFGLLQVANGSNPEDFGLVVGVRNAHDKSFPASPRFISFPIRNRRHHRRSSCPH